MLTSTLHVKLTCEVDTPKVEHVINLAWVVHIPLQYSAIYSMHICVHTLPCSYMPALGLTCSTAQLGHKDGGGAKKRSCSTTLSSLEEEQEQKGSEIAPSCLIHRIVGATSAAESEARRPSRASECNKARSLGRPHTGGGVPLQPTRTLLGSLRDALRALSLSFGRNEALKATSTSRRLQKRSPFSLNPCKSRNVDPAQGFLLRQGKRSSLPAWRSRVVRRLGGGGGIEDCPAGAYLAITFSSAQSCCQPRARLARGRHGPSRFPQPRASALVSPTQRKGTAISQRAAEANRFNGSAATLPVADCCGLDDSICGEREAEGLERPRGKLEGPFRGRALK